jgi:hypothetical protein
MSQTHYPEKWIERLCNMLEIPLDNQIKRFFTAWGKSEGGVSTWNPLNTTNHVHSQAHGDWQNTDLNSVGVCNFNHQWQGLCATVDTIQQAAFSDLLISLRHVKANGTSAEEIVQGHESALRLWGTNPQTMLDVLASMP